MKKNIKKGSLRAFLIIYMMSYFLQSFLYIDFGNKVYAKDNTEAQLDYTNIVAILVDDKIYNSISNDIERYAKDYIQGVKSTYNGTEHTNGNTNKQNSNTQRNSTIANIKSAITKAKDNILSIFGLGKDGELEETTQAKNLTENQEKAANLILNSTKATTKTQNNKKAEAIADTTSSTQYNKYNAISNSQAIVLQIDVDNITAPEIAQMLENIYFDGIEGTPSNLIGIVLIGDIPLPVVNQNGFIFPTIYPYIDFEDQKYIRDNNQQYFVYNDNDKGQAELRHGLIKFNTIQEYKDYFDKLKAYAEDPSYFVGKNIWYDDFIGNQKYFFEDGINSYVNNFLFAEDIGYSRYSDLMLSIMQGQHNETVSDTLRQLGELSGFNYSGDFQSDMNNFLSSSELSTPTMTIKKILDEGYLNSYTSLLGTKFIDTINTNVGTANRWFESYTGSNGAAIRSSLDTHYTTIEAKDETLLRTQGGLDPLLIAINNVLEEFVDDKVEQEKYRLNEIIPLTYLNYEGELYLGKCTRKTYDAFENYYFGSNAKYLTNMQDISTYRGTYRNYSGISGLTMDDIQNSYQPSTDLAIDLNKKSVGGSYDIFAQQVDANRGYNTYNTINELNLYNENKVATKSSRSLKCEKKLFGICWKRRKRHYEGQEDDSFIPESPQEYAIRNRGGASPLNLDSDMGWTSGYNYQDSIIPIFDIGGSKALNSPETGANSYLGINKYTRLIQKKFVVKAYKKNGTTLRKKFFFKNKEKTEADSNGKGYNTSMGENIYFTNYLPSYKTDDGEDIAQDDTGINRVYNPPKLTNSVNFFSKYNTTTTKEKQGNIIKLSNKNNGECLGNGTVYTYKTLDSRIKNTATNKEDIGGHYYYAFSDSSSPIYQLYESLSGELLNIELELQQDPTSTNGDGIINKLVNIKNILYRANSKINSITNTSKSTISGRTDTEIAEHAADRNTAYSSSTWATLSSNVSELQEDFQEIEGFFNSFSFDSVYDYLLNQKTTFTINNNELILLNSWKQNLITRLLMDSSDFINKTNNLDNWVDNAEDAYDNIVFYLFATNGKINDARDALDDIKDDINSLPGKCNGRYQPLCSAIDNIRSNLNNSGKDVKDKIEEIKKYKITKYRNNGSTTTENFEPFKDIKKNNLDTNDATLTYLNSLQLLNDIETTNDTGYQIYVEGMNITTSDRPIDSPKYLTFKGIGGDAVTFIYPDLYKVETYTGNDEHLTLLSPEEIATNIENYLRDVVKKYNSYLTGQQNKANNYYNQNSAAYNTLNQLDELASPNHVGDNIRPYNLFDEDYLIDLLVDKMNDNTFFTGNMGGYEPIEFLANMIYYQNITWPEREIGETIQDDMDNIRGSFDINQKIEHVFDNYIVSNHNSGSFLTPGYRDDGYEVAFINSDGNDYIVYETNLPFMESIKNSTKNYKKPTKPELDKTQLEEELERDCKIPEDGEGVLLFDLSEMSSPWIEAIKCRWSKLKETPASFKFSITRGNSALGFARNGTSEYGFAQTGWNRESISSQFGSVNDSVMSQLGIKDSINNANQNALNNASTQNYKKLNDIDTYVQIQSGKKNINADDANSTIKITSSVDIGNIYFYVTNLGENKIILSDESSIISSNITQGTTGYSTGFFTANPNNTKTLNLKIQNPKEGSNTIVLHMCPNQNDNINNCIAKMTQIHVIPGEITSLQIETLGNTIMEGSQMPIQIKGLDAYGNNVGELLTERFTISTSIGTIIHNSQEKKSISFSNFNESSFILNAVGSNLNGKTAQLTVSGAVGDKILQATKSINIIKGKLHIKVAGAKPIRTTNPIHDTILQESINAVVQQSAATASVSNAFNMFSTNGNTNSGNNGNATTYTQNSGTASGVPRTGTGNSNSSSTTYNMTSGVNLNIINNIGNMEIELPDENIYSYVDNFNITQANTEALPHLQIQLKDTNGNLLTNMNSALSVKSKTSLVKIGGITKKLINVDTGGTTVQIYQNKFSQTNSFTIKSGVIDIYLLPKFKAGQDTLYLSVPGIDTIQININIKSGGPKIVNLTFKSDSIKKGGHIDGNLMLYDNRGNIVTENTTIKLGTTGPISISGANTNPNTINISGGSFNFDVNALNKGGIGYVYAVISGIGLGEQQAGYKKFTVQDTILPTHDLNIMYLNLFGSDRGNQRGYFSENNNYVQELISNSEKLLATTTMLTSPDKIKLFKIAIDNNLHIANTEGSNIYFNLDNNINIGIDNVGYISVPKSGFNNIATLSVSEQNQLTGLQNILTHNNGNILIYIPESLDSIITGNELINKTIKINGKTIFNLNDGEQDLGLNIILSNENLSGYQIWNMYYNDTKIGDLLTIVRNSINGLTAHTINPNYSFNETWLGGSTNNTGIGLYEINSSFDDSLLGYPSIQDSTDPSLGIGFTAEFKNITNFGAGQTVGESTVPYSSEFLINIGDPLLKRINDNDTAKVFDENGNITLDTKFDKGLGELIYSDPTKSIFKVINIDFNNDNLEDIIVIYSDGTIKLLKNYGGTNPFHDMGPIMVIADRIKDVITGDVDGNGYEDIIIWTTSNILRVYHNYDGIFEVDGYPICININVHKGEISQNPTKVTGLQQIFFEDMDNDGSMDIITNDALGFIKIFYGGKNNQYNQDNYVSTNQYMCDDNWYSRLSNGSTNWTSTNTNSNIERTEGNSQNLNNTQNPVNDDVKVNGLEEAVSELGESISELGEVVSRLNNQHTTSSSNEIMVYRFAAKVNNTVKILDNSYVRRKGISNQADPEIDLDTLGIDAGELNNNGIDPDSFKGKKVSEIKSMIGLEDKLTQATNFDVDAAVNAYSVANRFQVVNFGVIPSYENNIIDENDIEYINIGWLTGNDPIDVYKTYEDLNGDVLEDGDKIEVTVTLHANSKLTGTFIDKISGPWIIPVDEEYDMIQNFWFETGGIITQNKINNELKFHRDLDHNRYMIDNIGMSAGSEIKIHYRLYYEATDIVNISLDDVDGTIYSGSTNDDMPNADGFIDFKTQPTDGCNPSMYVLFNNGTGAQRDYDIQYIDLGGILNNTTNTAQENFDEAVSEVTNGMLSTVTDDGKVDTSSIPAMSSILESSSNTDMFSDMFSNSFILENPLELENILQNNGIELSNLLDMPNQMIDALLGDVTDKIQSVISSACGGFDLGSLLGLGGGNCGLPVPFNESFLGPGDYHLFGCFNIVPLTSLIGKGMPLLNIPGNRPIPYPPGYLPAPGFFGYPFKGGTDTFSLGMNGGEWPSFFRLYIMPTLTAEIGFGLCFGTYATSQLLPQPFGSVGGNCVAFTVPLPCKKDKDKTSENETYNPSDLEGYADIPSCEQTTNQAPLGNGESNTCLQMASSSDDSNTMKVTVPGENDTNITPHTVHGGSYLGGFITIDKEPNTKVGYEGNASPISIQGEGIKLIGGAEQSNKILGSQVKGLIEKVVKSRLDKQIKYTMTTLTNFKLDIILPNFSEITAGLDSTLLDTIKSAAQDQRGSNSDKEKCNDSGGTRSSSLGQCITQEQKCKNKGKERRNGKCIKKTSQTATEEGLSSLDARLESSRISSEKISNASESNFANPLAFLENAFQDVALIDITTQNIDVEIPMVTSEMISAYANKSQNRLNEQKKILKEREELIYGLIGLCGGRQIDNFTDLKDAVKELKDELKAELQDSYKGMQNDIEKLKNQIKHETDSDKKAQLEDELNKKIGALNEILPLQNKINAIEKLNNKYDLSILNGFDLLERKDGTYLVQAGNIQINGEILPVDIYLLYKPTTGTNATATELTPFTKGINLETKKRGGKIVLKSISAKGNNEKIENPDLGIKESVANQSSNQCIDLFLGGGFDAALNSFLSIETNANDLINAVKQNLETLDQYKKLPTKLYEWIHIGDEYLGEISSFVSSFLGTLSMWMETNATRYSQYVNAIITIMTTIETYQAIINLAANWNEKCSTCSNDSYDQFTCILGLICPDGILPVLPLPPIKIPSIYIDLSNINIGTEIKLPKFNFTTTSIELPELPNLPHPPSFEIDLDSFGELGVNALGSLIGELLNINGNLNLGNIPLIPEPPELPDLPELDIEAEMELPVIPPAPKIPELPHEISAIIDAAEVMENILCIVKKLPLVNETSLKAKIEQLSQRTYEVPYWDTMDQTFKERGGKIGSSLKDNLLKKFMPYLAIDGFEDINVKGFDVKLETYINLQANFDELYDFLNVMVGEVNGYSKKAGEYVSNFNNTISNISNDITVDLQKCINNPLENPDCFNYFQIPNAARIIEQYNKKKEQVESYKKTIQEGFTGINTKKQEISDLTNKIENIESDIDEKEKTINRYEEKIKGYENRIESANSRIIKDTLSIQVNAYRRIIKEIENEISELNETLNIDNKKLTIITNAYGPIINEYDNIMAQYNNIYEEYQALTTQINELKDSLTNAISNISSGANSIIDQIGNLGNEIQSNSDLFEQKQTTKRTQRYNNLQDLYQEIEPLGYVDYNKDTVSENTQILTDALNNIKGKTDDKSIIKDVNSYLKLVQSDSNIYANTDSLNNIQKEYSTILAQYKQNTQEIKELISQDYDKFLYAIANNDKKLVNNDNIDIKLSSPLFTMDKNVKNTLSNSDNIYKMFLDYYDDNLNGYINALDNNTPNDLNMDEAVYNMNKDYLYEIKEKSKLAYAAIDNEDIKAKSNDEKQNNILLSQTVTPIGNNGNSNSSSSSTSYINLSTYFDGQILSTPEGGFMLANSDFTKEFQDQSIMVDINKDNKNDLILRDDHEIYIKYRDNNSNYSNTNYNNGYYMYHITSYDDLVNDSDDGYISIKKNLIDTHQIKIKLWDDNREVKNFKYAGGDFDNITISWTNSNTLGDTTDGYLVKLIHRADLFNDKEVIVNNSNKGTFDKKYIIVLPKGTNTEGMKISLDNGDTVNVLSDDIFDINYYNENTETINLLVTDIPRNWQYSEIYTLKLQGDKYTINSSSSNQVVGGPQIIADDEGPEAEIEFYRPSTDTTIDDGGLFEGYVSTNYTLKAYWEDNALIDSIWITDEDGIILNKIDHIFAKTGYIELSGLKFNEVGVKHYYFVGTDINGNTSSEDITLTIKIPKIEITNIWKELNSTNNMNIPTSIEATLDHDLDEGIVQFLRERNHIRSILTGTKSGIKTDKYNLQPNQTIITGQYYDFGEDIGIYLSNGDLAAKINPKNGKISIEHGYENIISIEVDYGNHYPIIKISENNQETLMLLQLDSKEVVDVRAFDDLKIKKINGNQFNIFNGGTSIIENNEILMYISPTGQIYTDHYLYGDYSFNDKEGTVIYSFKKNKKGDTLGEIEFKIKNILGE